MKIQSKKKNSNAFRCGFQSILTTVCLSLALYLYFITNQATQVTTQLLAMQQQATSTGNSNGAVRKQFVNAMKPADDGVHKVAGLNCQAYNGPNTQEAVDEMVYWRDIPQDATYESPYKKVGPEVKYLTFEPDEGKLRAS